VVVLYAILDRAVSVSVQRSAGLQRARAHAHRAGAT
jgi:hypothetical protein